MKTMKKLFACVFSLVLCASLACVPLAPAASGAPDAPAAAGVLVPASAFAASSDDQSESESADELSVVDQGGLLSNTQMYQLTQRFGALADETGVGVYFVSAKSLGGQTPQAYASRIYSTMDMGRGSDASGIVMLVCMDEGVLDFTTYGKAEDEFSAAELGAYYNDVRPYLNRGDYAGALETFAGDVEKTLTGTNSTESASKSVGYAQGSYVIDDYGLFSESEYDALEASAEKLAQDYAMGVYLLVVDTMGSMNPSSAARTNFATSFYRQNNLGLGSGKDGIMLVIAVESRDYVTIAYGQGSYSFSDEGIEAMEDAVTDKLGDNDWYGGCAAYYSSMDEQLAYYEARGQTWTKPNLFSLILKILAILGIPAGVAASVVGREKSAMQTAREQSEASNYLDRSSLVMQVSNDQFVNTTLAVTPKPKESSSGGGGGGWGGGGGGGFSSSGGGKF